MDNKLKTSRTYSPIRIGIYEGKQLSLIGPPTAIEEAISSARDQIAFGSREILLDATVDVYDAFSERLISDGFSNLQFGVKGGAMSIIGAEEELRRIVQNYGNEFLFELEVEVQGPVTETRKLLADILGIEVRDPYFEAWLENVS